MTLSTPQISKVVSQDRAVIVWSPTLRMANRCSYTAINALGDCIYDFVPLGFESYVNNANKKVEVQDPLEEVDIGFDNVKRPTYRS